MEPSADAIAAVQANLEGATPISQPAPPQPAPTPAPAAPQAPAQQQPAQPTPQPAPSQQPQDPFSTLFQEPAQPAPAAPAAPVAPQAPAQPTQPTEPVTTPQPENTPVEPSQPAPQEPKYQTFEEYMESVNQGVGEAPTVPDPNKIDPNDEAGIKNFFDDLVNTAVQRANQDFKRTTALQTSERQLWDSAFDKYGSLRDNKNLRDMVHAIRMGEFQRGVAITPTQAADRLLDALKGQYQKGVADNQVVTTIENVQPTGGGSAPVQTSADMENVLTSVQTGGETALAAYLDSQVKAGNI